MSKALDDLKSAGAEFYAATGEVYREGGAPGLIEAVRKADHAVQEFLMYLIKHRNES